MALLYTWLHSDAHTICKQYEPLRGSFFEFESYRIIHHSFIFLTFENVDLNDGGKNHLEKMRLRRYVGAPGDSPGDFFVDHSTGPVGLC
ncbi:hypothetical protein PIB30_027762 [Stylosanthes scabra]|uniref:Uncharacterized protein n=1 Tax=Stylosanthes scabra TaxID=79078 RepID=A0ABU6YCL8_9FABA|nr:hypothetical protein [Stylosanthes scabra]